MSSPPALRRSTSSSSASWASDMTTPSTPRTEDDACPRVCGNRTFTEFLSGHGADYDASISPNLLHRPDHGSRSSNGDVTSDHEEYYGETAYENRDRSGPPFFAHYSVPEDNQIDIRYPLAPVTLSSHPSNETPRIYDSRSYNNYPLSPESKGYHYTHGYSSASQNDSNPRDSIQGIQCVIPNTSSGYCEDSGMSGDESMYMSNNISMNMAPRSCRENSGPTPTSTTGRRKAKKRSSSRLPYVVTSNDKPHVCGICQRRFRRPEHLRRHQLAHTGEKPHACNIGMCRRQFSRTDNLRAHRRTHTTPGGRNSFYPEVDPDTI